MSILNMEFVVLDICEHSKLIKIQKIAIQL